MSGATRSGSTPDEKKAEPVDPGALTEEERATIGNLIDAAGSLAEGLTTHGSALREGLHGMLSDVTRGAKLVGKLLGGDQDERREATDEIKDSIKGDK